jgi:hypothetical protein
VTYFAKLHGRGIDSVWKGPAFVLGSVQSSGNLPEDGGGVVAPNGACVATHPASIASLMPYHEEGFVSKPCRWDHALAYSRRARGSLSRHRILAAPM